MEIKTTIKKRATCFICKKKRYIQDSQIIQIEVLGKTVKLPYICNKCIDKQNK